LNAAQLEAPLPNLRLNTLKEFGADFGKSKAVGMKMGNLGEYLPTLGGDLLVNGLGYHVEARTSDQVYPCVFEDEAGLLYFLIPPSVTAFEVVPRVFNADSPDESIFDAEFRYTVTVAAPARAPKPAAPAEMPVAEPPAPADAPATDAASASTTETLPPNFFGESNQ
jgi:hypothetical protein